MATDYLSCYAEAKTLPKGSANEVANFFVDNIPLQHGTPEVLITDKAISFMAHLTQAIL